MSIAAIILAAGRGTRFLNGRKLMAPFQGAAVIHHVQVAVEEARVDTAVIVTQPGAKDLTASFDPARWTCIENADFASGMASSLRLGLLTLTAHHRGVIVLLADMPLITAALLNQLIDAFDAAGGQKIVYPQSASGQQGNPVVWPASFVPHLMQTMGDRGGKAVMLAHLDRCQPLLVHDESAFLDIDTTDDLASLADRV